MNNNESAAARDARAVNDADIAQLKALGYSSNFDRSMNGPEKS